MQSPRWQAHDDHVLLDPSRMLVIVPDPKDGIRFQLLPATEVEAISPKPLAVLPVTLRQALRFRTLWRNMGRVPTLGGWGYVTAWDDDDNCYVATLCDDPHESTASVLDSEDDLDIFYKR